MNLDQIARVCHEVNRAYCQALGDNTQASWEDAPEWQRASARMGVDLHTMGDFGPEASHISWMKQKLDDGWVYGGVKDAEAKTHPCLIPFNQLPVAQQAKDFIFRAVVHALNNKGDKMQHVMIDLETLGTQPGSVVLSIGAVLFDPSKPVDECLGEEFYSVISRQSCEAAKLEVSQDTLDWWEKQSPEARTVLTQTLSEEATAIGAALKALADFIPVGAKVWSNGANFDQPLLDVAYNRCGITLPWKYWNSRCYRTIVALHPNEKGIRPPTVCAHNALEDAKWQAIHMTGVVSALDIKI